MSSEEPIQKNDQRGRKRDVWDWIEFFLEIVALPVLIAYTCFSYQQWRATRDQWSVMNASYALSHESLVRENRPWIGIVGDNLAVKETKPLSEWQVSYTLKNYGLSPARRAIPYSTIQLGEIEKWSGHICEEIDSKHASNSQEPAGVIFPTVESKISELVKFPDSA